MRPLKNIVPEYYTILKNYIEECWNIIIKTGIETKLDYNSLKLYFFNSKRVLGEYDATGEMGVSLQYFEYCITTSNYFDLENTIIHELLHFIAENKNPGCMHGGLWKEYANIISQKTKYKIECKAKNCNFINAQPAKEPKYTIICQDCGQEVYYYRKCQAIKYFMEHTSNTEYRCLNCKSLNLKLK